MDTCIKHMAFFTPKFFLHESTKVLQCGYQEATPGHIASQKIVDHYIFHAITSGKGIYCIHDQTFHLKKGDCFLLIPDTPIRYQADVKEPWIYYWIGFDGLEIKQLLSLCGLGDKNPVTHYPDVERLGRLIAPLITCDPSLLSQNYYALGQLYQLLSLFMENNTDNHPLSRKEFYAEQVTAYINENYSGNIVVQDIAHHIGLDRTYLYRVFKEVYGMSIQNYIVQFRLEKACHFLTYSNFSISQISQYCGFFSVQQFSYLFKKNIHCSPSEYRKRLQSTRNQK